MMMRLEDYAANTACCLWVYSIIFEQSQIFERCLECLLLALWLVQNLCKESSRYEQLKDRLKSVFEEKRTRFHEYFQQEGEIKQILEKALGRKIYPGVFLRQQKVEDFTYDRMIYEKFGFDQLNKQQVIVFKAEQLPGHEQSPLLESGSQREIAKPKMGGHKYNQSMDANASQQTNFTSQGHNSSTTFSQGHQKDFVLETSKMEASSHYVPTQFTQRLDTSKNHNLSQTSASLPRFKSATPSHQRGGSGGESRRPGVFDYNSDRVLSSNKPYARVLLRENPAPYRQLQFEAEGSIDTDGVIGDIVRRRFNESGHRISDFKSLRERDEQRTVQDSQITQLVRIEKEKLSQKEK